MEITVKQALEKDSAMVAELVHALLSELTPADESMPVLVDIQASTENLLHGDGPVWAFVAYSDGDEAVGVLTLNECAAIYAGGKFGEICEFYVAPNARSAGVGPKLLDAAKTFAQEKGWPRLEVGAPDLPRWVRTQAFYLKNGFVDVGPRLKLIL